MLNKIFINFKKQIVNSILTSVGIILALTSLIMHSVNCGLEYFKTDANSPIVQTFLILSFITLIVVLGLRLSPLGDNKIVGYVTDALIVVVAGFIMFAAFTFIGDRVEKYGYTFASDLESGNPVARPSCIHAIVGQVIMIISSLVVVASAFFGQKKEKVQASIDSSEEIKV